MTDSRLTADLALLGRIAQERLPSVDTSLKRFEAAITNREHLAVSLAQTFVQRTGRIAAGITAMVGVTSTLAHLSVNLPPNFRELSLVDQLLGGSMVWVAAVMLEVIAFVYSVATVIAARHVEHVLQRGGVPAAQHLVDRVERWATGLTIAGVLSPILFFGMMRVVIGHRPLMQFMFQQSAPELSLPWGSTFVLTVVALGAGWIGAVIVARLPTSVRLPTWAVVTAAAAFAVTLWVGVRFDVGPVNYHFDQRASVPLRATLTTTGTLSLLVLVSAAVLRRRR